MLGSWEEWLLALVRQAFEETTRFLNGLGAWFLGLFSHSDYRTQLKRTWQDQAWPKWWATAAARPSAFNALVASLVKQQEPEPGLDAQPTEPDLRAWSVAGEEPPSPGAAGALKGARQASGSAVHPHGL